MIRGTTPTHTFETDMDLRAATIYVTYVKDGEVVFEKGNDDILEITDEQFSIKFTQEETLQLNRYKKTDMMHIQIRAIFVDGTAVASNVMDTMVYDILKQGEIEFTGQADPDYIPGGGGDG